jgi:glycosyltransferase involved in cell wall biosynthesis
VKVSLITTFKDEEKGIEAFLESIYSQSRLPDEIIMVDGGSTDRTASLVHAHPARSIPTQLILEGECNISQGRNRAIRAAAHDVIAVTDAGCICDGCWLEELVAPMESDPEISVVAGTYTVEPAGLWERLTAAYLMPFPDRACRDTPSGRSTGFRRHAWKDVGGYPEWLDHAEDSYFAVELRKRGYRFHFAPKARVRWRPRSTPRSFFKQYFLYGVGDGKAGLSIGHYGRKISLYGLGIILAALGSVTLLVFLAAFYLIVMMARFWSRGKERELVLLLPPVILLHDLAQVTGFAVGMMRGRRRT